MWIILDILEPKVCDPSMVGCLGHKTHLVKMHSAEDAGGGVAPIVWCLTRQCPGWCCFAAAEHRCGSQESGWCCPGGGR